MAVLMTCECGSSYDLKDEFAGKLVKCPHCGFTHIWSKADAKFD